MVRTRVGYAGGRKANPTYHSLGDHTETIQIDFVPQTISFAELLDVFWRAHNPTRQARSRQYMSAVFTHDEQQRRIVMESMARESERRGQRIATDVLPYTGFTLAEDYHQKYSLRHVSALVREFEAMYPDLLDFVNSTAVTRANGFAGGYGTMDTLHDEIEQYGISQAGREALLGVARRYHR